jgi:hypothetical protein
MRRPPCAILAACLISLIASTVTAQIGLKTRQTETMRLIYYSDEHEYITPHLARCFENSMAFHRKLFGYTPNEQVSVLLQDFDDFGYAGASALPSNYLTIGIEPFEYVYETSPTNERLNWVMSHELLHIVGSDAASPGDRFFRKLFQGKVVATNEQPLSFLYSFLTAPRRYAPRWYHEGMAVFMETWMAGGIGRALGGYDEMVFRTMVADGAYMYRLVGLESEGTTTDFQVGQNAYLYGTRFMSYIAYTYGPEELVKWFNRTEGSKGHYALQFKHVFGLGIGDAWNNWIEWEHEWQQGNLAHLRGFPLTEYRVLSEQALGSVSRAYFDSSTRKLYTAALYPAEFAHIAAIDVDRWHMDKITKVKTPAIYYVSSLAYDDSTGNLYFTTDNGRSYRDLNVVDVKTGKTRQLLKDFRTGDIVFNRIDKSIWGIQHHNGLSHLVRIPEPYSGWQTVLTLPYGTDLFDIDVSPDGEALTGSMVGISGRQRLIRLQMADLMLSDSRFETLFEFPNNSPANFVHSGDGRYLFGTSYYSGVSNVFRYEFSTSKMEIITNADTGFFRPVPVSNDSLIVLRYTSKGFVPVMMGIEPIDVLSMTAEPHPEAKPYETIRAARFLGQEVVDKHPVVKSWMLGSPADVNIDSLTIVSGTYTGIANIGLSSIYPVVESYKDRTAFGLRFNFMEPIGLHDLNVTTSYSPAGTLPDDERLHATAHYASWPYEFNASYNAADFYDLFGPTKTSRKGYSGSVQYKRVLLDDRPRRLESTFRLAGYGGLERLPDAQNVSVSFDKYLTTSASLSYSSLGKTIGGIAKENGIRWRIQSLANYVNEELFPRVWGDLDYGFLLPWDHSSVWIRSSLGKSFGDRFEPFANFFFGGFGNNWVDHGGVNRYREYYSFPGVELNELAGTNFGKLTLEWVLPPLRFRELGFQTLYANWANLQLFATGITTNWDNEPIRQSMVNTGAQLDFKLVSFTAIPYTFSVGYAAAFEYRQRPSDEVMISLKIFK